ncbi:MAG TPA: hypothetical protein VGY48_01330 [Vicinamibacterales bacterium]|nr:hypothetical protein [Vicinamibacterales bacterium]
MPVISTLWPTCAVSLEASASRRYVVPIPDVPVAEELGLVDEAPLALGELDAWVSMKLELDAPAVPLVPVAPVVALAVLG